MFLIKNSFYSIFDTSMYEIDGTMFEDWLDWYKIFCEFNNKYKMKRVYDTQQSEFE